MASSLKKKGGKAPFGIVPRPVMCSGLSIEAKAIYCLLSTYADQDGYCFPSLETLQANLRISKKRLRRYMTELRESGFMRVERERRGNLYSGNVYTLLGVPDGYETTLSDGYGLTLSDRDNTTPSERVKSSSADRVKTSIFDGVNSTPITYQITTGSTKNSTRGKQNQAGTRRNAAAMDAAAQRRICAAICEIFNAERARRRNKGRVKPTNLPTIDAVEQLVSAGWSAGEIVEAAKAYAAKQSNAIFLDAQSFLKHSRNSRK